MKEKQRLPGFKAAVADHVRIPYHLEDTDGRFRLLVTEEPVKKWNRGRQGGVRPTDEAR